MKHFMYVPFTGLGLYNGSRGSRWLRNRIKIFKQFVIPSLQNQTSQNFIVWVSWRPEEVNNKHVSDLHSHLVEIFGEDRVVFTYKGICFYDDKFEDIEAKNRLMNSLHASLPYLIDYIGETDCVLMTIQPSDDLYVSNMVENMQSALSSTKIDAMGYSKGYIMNYQTAELREYNPETNPPFFTIKFTKEQFTDAFKHFNHIGPYKSHEYIGNHLTYAQINERGFLVGTHGENISTHINNPYAGDEIKKHAVQVATQFGFTDKTDVLRIKYSLRKQLMRRLPYGWQRKLRYIFGEKLYSKFYNFIRS